MGVWHDVAHCEASMVLASVSPWTSRKAETNLNVTPLISSTVYLGVCLKRVFGNRDAISREEVDERVGGEVCGTAFERG